MPAPPPPPSPAPTTPPPDGDAAILRQWARYLDTNGYAMDGEGSRYAVAHCMRIASRLDVLTRDLASARAEREEYRREWESACERDRAANALRVEAEAALAQAQKERDAALAEGRAARGRWEHRDGPCDYCGT